MECQIIKVIGSTEYEPFKTVEYAVQNAIALTEKDGYEVHSFHVKSITGKVHKGHITEMRVCVNLAVDGPKK